MQNVISRLSFSRERGAESGFLSTTLSPTTLELHIGAAWLPRNAAPEG